MKIDKNCFRRWFLHIYCSDFSDF